MKSLLILAIVAALSSGSWMWGWYAHKPQTIIEEWRYHDCAITTAALQIPKTALREK